MSSERARRLIVHAGTHKTGTKSIQLFLIEHVRELFAEGIGLLDAGRIMLSEHLGTPGNHRIAIALRDDDPSELLRSLTDEMLARGTPTIVISSEEFHPLHAQPARLRRLIDAVASIGYRSHAVLYLRARGSYLESLYSEYLKTPRNVRFGDLVRDVVERGALDAASGTPIAFAYARMLDGLAEAFAEDAITVRPFDASRPNDAVIVDMLDVLRSLHGPLGIRVPSSEQRENARSTFADALLALQARAQERRADARPAALIAIERGEDPSDPFFISPLSPLLRDEAIMLAERFRSDDEEIFARTNVVIPASGYTGVEPPDDPRWERARRQRALLDAAFEEWFAT